MSKFVFALLAFLFMGTIQLTAQPERGRIGFGAALSFDSEELNLYATLSKHSEILLTFGLSQENYQVEDNDYPDQKNPAPKFDMYFSGAYKYFFLTDKSMHPFAGVMLRFHQIPKNESVNGTTVYNTSFESYAAAIILGAQKYLEDNFAIYARADIGWEHRLQINSRTSLQFTEKEYQTNKYGVLGSSIGIIFYF